MARPTRCLNTGQSGQSRTGRFARPILARLRPRHAVRPQQAAGQQRGGPIRARPASARPHDLSMVPEQRTKYAPIAAATIARATAAWISARSTATPPATAPAARIPATMAGESMP